jgi:hypothetical protein
MASVAVSVAATELPGGPYHTFAGIALCLGFALVIHGGRQH